MMSKTKIETLLEVDSKTEEQEAKQTNPTRTFHDVMYNGSTGKVARTIYGFLNDKERAKLSSTSVDARRFESVDRTLTDDKFKVSLMTEILNVLDNPDYAEQLSISRNPSGFLRLNNDLIRLISKPELLNALTDAAELRLNFWPGDLYPNLGAKLEKETGHSHPRGFTSFIVTGGYYHDIHLPSNNEKDPGYMVFRGYVEPDKKRFEKQEGTHHLEHQVREKFEASSGYSYFSTSMIHNVVDPLHAESPENDHGTLTINVVFNALKSAPIPEYDLYMNDAASLVEKYDKLSPELAGETLEIVKGLLRGKIKELTATIEEKETANIPSPVEETKVSNSPTTFFSHKDSFDLAIDELNSELDDNIGLPILSNTEGNKTDDDSLEIRNDGIVAGV
ncbi:hypothetical protein BN59_02163 [Legionella massiliensis]|uniref:Uncharacterized protein n=1 Tax=Legionella massiliensis TaxID=1034943 RepID=A0A078KTT9_9GAMM|nr:hypothetical protein [Legionella massiliensis]CDZ77870.1 hypothetical protein BN59_02163 [Legionella massiliensis]CEE13608.1 hypothetical protein BN1094_02163 [Legionella massiliensis]